MNIRRRDALLGMAGAMAVAAGGGWWYYRKNATSLPQSLLLAGSSTMNDLNRALLDGFAKVHPQVISVLQGGGSLAGLMALKRGAVDVAAMSRDLTEAEDTAQTRSHLVAMNEVSIVVHPASPIKALSRAQVRAVFTGQIPNWQALGGPNAPIRVISRTHGASSLRFVLDELLNGEEMVLTARAVARAKQVGAAVAADPFAIGFVAMSDRVEGPLRRLAIDGVLPDRATVLSGRYPLEQPLYLVLHGEPSAAARDFVAFALSPKGQAIVADSHFLPVA